MKTENINICISPIGSALKLDKKKLKRSDGTWEYYKLIWALCRQKSVSKITIIQRSDWATLSYAQKVELDPRGIIYDFFTENPIKIVDDGSKESYNYVWETLKNHQLPDFGLFFTSQGFSNVSIPNLLPKLTDVKNDKNFKNVKNEDRFCKPLLMSRKYSAPIVHYLNMSKIPWYMISTDPRYIKENLKRRDCQNYPLSIIGQYDQSINFFCIDEYENYKYGDKETPKNILMKYSGIEKLNLINENIISPESNRDNKFSIVAMQTTPLEFDTKPIKDYRLEELKKWIFSKDEDGNTSVYGKWSEHFESLHPQLKGLKTPEEIDTIFANTRYTFIIPLRPHWVTSKYAEMLRIGVVPFFHPDYDTNFNVLPADHFVRIKTPDELFKKMKYLDENPEKRIKLVKSLQLQLLKNVRTGGFLCDIINRFNNENCVNIQLKDQYDDTILRKNTITPLW